MAGHSKWANIKHKKQDKMLKEVLSLQRLLGADSCSKEGGNG